MIEKLCRAPAVHGGRCGRIAEAVIRPSGKRKVERWSCGNHIVWHLRALQIDTGINRLNVTLLNTTSLNEAVKKRTSMV